MDSSCICGQVQSSRAETCESRGYLNSRIRLYSATAAEAREVAAVNGDAHVCANRTCEIGLTRATGETYESFIYLLERLSR